MGELSGAADGNEAARAQRPGQVDLSRWALLSIVVAIATIALKMLAWQLTGSVGLLSDAAESVVNLVAAVVAFIALKVAVRPADDSHNFGHGKVEYFSSVIEGVMIVLAAIVIIVSAVDRLRHPAELEQVGVGLAVSVVATVLNGVVALLLIRAGRRHRSLTLEADGRHLATDVWTTVGVVVGVAAVAVTGWTVLDPIVAIAVAVNIVVVGGGLIGRSAAGLMDAAVEPPVRTAIEEILDGYRAREPVDFHDVRTRRAGRLRYVQFHLLVPGDWSVRRGHDLADRIESDLCAAVDGLIPVAHLEPVDDDRSYEPWRR